MRDLSELNLNEGGGPVARAAPSREVIAAFESRFGVTIPEAQLQLLRHSNGGHPERDSILSPDGSWARWSVNRFHHLDTDETDTSGLWAAMKQWRPVLGPLTLPFAADGGGNPFFLDLRVGPPSVKVCLHDEGFAVVEVAPSFEAFVDALSIDPDAV
jgi:hypothetical protein